MKWECGVFLGLGWNDGKMYIILFLRVRERVRREKEVIGIEILVLGENEI